MCLYEYCICMYLPVSVCMCMYVHVCKFTLRLASEGRKAPGEMLTRRLTSTAKCTQNSNKMPLTFLGLEHTSAIPCVTICTTEPQGLYILRQNVCICIILVTYIHIHTIHTHTYTYIHIHTDTYRYIQIHTHMHPLKTGLDGGFPAGQRPLATRWRGAIPPDHLGCCSRRDHSMHMAHGRPIGGTRDSLCPPPTRAARSGAPKRVRGWVPDGGVKWSGTCPGSP